MSLSEIFVVLSWPTTSTLLFCNSFRGVRSEVVAVVVVVVVVVVVSFAVAFPAFVVVLLFLELLGLSVLQASHFRNSFGLMSMQLEQVHFSSPVPAPAVFSGGLGIGLGIGLDFLRSFPTFSFLIVIFDGECSRAEYRGREDSLLGIESFWLSFLLSFWLVWSSGWNGT